MSYDDMEICPEEQSSIVSKVTYSWLNSFFKKGSKKLLDESDICQLPKRYQTEELEKKYLNYKVESKCTNGQPSLFALLRGFFGFPVVMAFFPRFISDLCILAVPILIQHLLKNIKDLNSYTLTEIFRISFFNNPFVLLLGVFFVSLTQSICFRYYYQIINMEGLGIINFLCILIYNRSMKISLSGDHVI